MPAPTLRSLSVALSLAAALLIPGTASLAKPSFRDGGVVYFNRAAGFGGAFRRPVVLIDGQRIGSIGAGECHAIRLPAGPHHVVVRDETSILSRLGFEIHAKRIFVDNGRPLFVTVRPLQELSNFNDRETTYDLMVSDRGQRC